MRKGMKNPEIQVVPFLNQKRGQGQDVLENTNMVGTQIGDIIKSPHTVEEEQDEIQLQREEGIMRISKIKIPQTFARVKRLINSAGEGQKDIDRIVIELINQSIQAEISQNTGVLERNLLFLESKIKSLQIVGDKSSHPLEELTEETLKQQDVYFKKIVQDVFYKELLDEAKYLENIAAITPLNTQLIAGIRFSEEKKIKMIFDTFATVVTLDEKRIMDLTEEDNVAIARKFENQLHEQRAFISTLGHEYGTPSVAFFGFAEFLDEDFTDDENRVFTEQCVNASKQYRKSLCDLMPLLDDPDYKKIDIAQTKLGQPQSRADLKNVTLDVKLNHTVYSDATRIVLLLNNLINNAIKFTPGKGKVEIFSEELEDGSIKISIKDNGIGMSKDLLKNKQRMFRGEIPREKSISRVGTNGEEGTGKGLRNCLWYADQVGILLSVESIEGEGSIFSFIVPATNEQHISNAEKRERIRYP